MFTFRLSLFLFMACVAGASPLVVTTNTILDDLVRQVGGDDIRARCLVEAGVDPHAYEPKPADIRLIAQADLVMVNGLGLETWIAKLIQNSGFHGTLVTASQGVTPRPLSANDPLAAETGASGVDPHAWQDVRNVIRYVETIRAAFVKADPAQAAAYNTRAAAYTRELETLQAYATARFATIPPERRKLVTSHDALGYLALAYGFTIVPIAGLTPDQEPDARQLARIITFIRTQRVPAVFVESTGNPKIPELIADDAPVTVATSLFTDSLGQPRTSEATYVGMFRHNVDAIVAALR